MKKRYSLFTLIVAIISAVVILSGCGGETADEGEVKDLIFSLESVHAEEFDPILSSVGDQFYLQLIYRSLMKIDAETLDAVPDMAEDYEVSEDGKIWTFYLRKGVQFHKEFGEMKASDVVFSYERCVDPETNSRYATDFKIVDTVEADGDYTVIFKLKEPFAPFPYLLTERSLGSLIVSEKAVEEYGDDYSSNPIGTGPFAFGSWTPGQETVLKSNADYYEGAPKVNLVLKEITEASTSLMALQKGEIHGMDTQVLEILQQAEGIDNLVVSYEKIPLLYGVFLNVTKEPFDDVRVRQAIAHAIDKKAICNTVFGEKMVEVAEGVVPSLLEYYTTDGVQNYPYDPEKAKELLAEAGYPNGFEMEAKPRDDQRNTRIFTMIQEQLAKVGIDMKVTPAAGAEWAAWQYSGDALIGYFPMARAPEIHFFMYGYYHSDSHPPASNGSFYSGIDDLLDEAVATMDSNERARLYKEAQQKLSEDVPWVLLYESKTMTIVDQKVKGIYAGRGFNSDSRFEKAVIED